MIFRSLFSDKISSDLIQIWYRIDSIDEDKNKNRIQFDRIESWGDNFFSGFSEV